MRLAILTCLLMSLTFVAEADSFGALKGRYKVDPSSTIHFSVAQMGGQAIEGWFRKFSGQFVLAGEDASGSTVQFTLSPASVETAVINGRLSAKGLTRDAKFNIRYEGRSGGGLKFHVTGKISRALVGMEVGTSIYSNVVVLDMGIDRPAGLSAMRHRKSS